MDIHTFGAEKKIERVILSMISDPRSWQGWMALRVESTDNLSEEDFVDVSLSVRAVLESYLKDIEGSAYFCLGKNIYLICKNPPVGILEQAGSQICALSFGETNRNAEHQVYDLGKEIADFTTHVMNALGLKVKSVPQDASHEKGEAQDGPVVYGRKKVLLVEDDAVTRWLIRNSLIGECELATAQSANGVFVLYSSFKPDLVFLDIGLPDNSGHDVLEWIMRKDPEAKVVMLSSKDNVENISSCLEKGAKGFIPKPFVQDNLLHYIRTCADQA